MSRKNYYFFSLSDPRDPEEKPVYIGSTTENYNVRVSKMVSTAITKELDYKVYEWIRELVNLDLRPRIHPIWGTEKISEEEEAEIHKRLIEEQQAIGNCQLNMTTGRGARGLKYEMSMETKQNISEATRQELPLEVIAMLRDDGKSWKEIAAQINVGSTTLNKRKAEIQEYIDSRPKPQDYEEGAE